MTRGRRPEGGRLVERLDGSAGAKARLAVFVEVLAGRRTAAAGALALGISERRFHALRNHLLQAALERLEPRPAGRPAHRAAEPGGQTAALRAQVRDLRLELRAAQIREEIALAMPHLLLRAGRSKKKARGPGRRRKSGASVGCGPSGRPAPPNRTGRGGRRGSGRRGRWSVPSGPRPWPSPAGRPAGACRCHRPPGGWGLPPAP
jgi:hypothetical protein